MSIRDIIIKKNKESEEVRDKIKIKIKEFNSADDGIIIEKLAEEIGTLHATAILLQAEINAHPAFPEIAQLYATVAPIVRKILEYKKANKISELTDFIKKIIVGTSSYNESVKIIAEVNSKKKSEITDHSNKLKKMEATLCDKYKTAKNYAEIKVEIQQYKELLESIPGALAAKMQSCLDTTIVKEQPETYCHITFECSDMSDNNLITPISKELSESLELLFCN